MAITTRLTKRLGNADAEAVTWRKAWVEGDIDVADTFVGEAAGLIHGIEPAAAILERLVKDAETRLTGATRLVER